MTQYREEIIRIRDFIITAMAEVARRQLSPSAEIAEKSFGVLGVDSVSIVQLHLRIEEEFSLSLPDNFLIDHNTPALAAEVLATQLQASHRPPP